MIYKVRNEKVEIVENYGDGTMWVRFLTGPKKGSNRTVSRHSVKVSK